MQQTDDLIIKGIASGKYAFKGPKIVQLDLTGVCNSNCIGCWIHSPYIKNPPADKGFILPFNKAKKLITELAFLDTEEIFISGAGEPFLHPNILEIVELVKSFGLKLNIVTNFTMVNEQKTKSLIELGVDLITASIWAGSQECYIKTHPNKTRDDFCAIKENLRRFSMLKLKEGKYYPRIKIYNVICNLNYNEIHQMVDFALETGADFIEFQMMDLNNETAFLALSNEQIESVKSQFRSLMEDENLYFKELAYFASHREKEFREFPGRFIKIPKNFILRECIKENKDGTKSAVHSLVCPSGFSNEVSSKNPLIEEGKNTVTFFFNKENCKSCISPKKDCSVDEEKKISLRHLKILGFSSFMRRINSGNAYEQIYEKDVIENNACYTGWTYSRILSTGKVIPCCKAVKKPLGNINKNNFSEIWNSPAYQQFRYNAKMVSKSNSYFAGINCYKSCDNVGMNSQIKESLESRDPGFDYRFSNKEEFWGISFLPAAEIEIIISAIKASSTNLNINMHKFGEGIIIDGGKSSSFAEYKVNFYEEGEYEFWSYYASDEPRPVELFFDGSLVKKEVLNCSNGGWGLSALRWFRECAVNITKGEHLLKIQTQGLIPHIHSFAFLKGVKILHANSDNYENIYKKPTALRHLKDKINTAGFVSSSAKIIKYIQSRKLIDNYLDIMGVFNGVHAFKGPSHVQIDLTNNCNNNCIACWCNSPLLEEKALKAEQKSHTLPFELLKESLDELASLGTQEIYFSGGGEPFMHPQIMEILDYAKKKKFSCYVNTNFTLLDKEKIKRIIDLGIDHLTVSTWAATPEIYAATHPNKDAQTFKQITENIKFLNKNKKKTPYIKLYNVISNLNYHELKDMVIYAKETGSESLEFTLVDTMPGKTDKLLLDSNQTRELQNYAQELMQKLDKNSCYDGVLLFRFSSFLRRISSSSDLAKATYDRNIIDKIPCYIGWNFARLMPNGDVNACLKAHRIPTGNLYKESFSAIWNGEKQRYFRKKTLVYKKNDAFFRLIGNDPEIEEAGCYKSCDDIGRNVYIHNRIMSLTPLERGLLRVAAKFKKKPILKHKYQCKDLMLRGVADGRQAFVGPEHVVMDLTNRCNERCVGCWLYSPLLKEKTDAHWLVEEIDFQRAKALIDDLAILGTKRIRFTGGGEPFMHPKIMELIEYTKSSGLICSITTNFSLMDKEKVRDLIRLGVDELAISLWASNEYTYQKTHPGTSKDIFGKVRKNLEILLKSKRGKPFVTLCNVICNLNYLEIEEMFRFAVGIGADGVYFTLVDALDGTDSLLLDKKQGQELLRQSENIQRAWENLPKERRIKLDYFDGFISRIKEDSALFGNYDKQRINQLPCYAGWIFARILADGKVSPCCRGVKKVMGNINDRGFKEIWFSERYNEFRAKAKYLPKADSFFREIDCIKMCDNLMHNEEIDKRLKNKE